MTVKRYIRRTGARVYEHIDPQLALYASEKFIGSSKIINLNLNSEIFIFIRKVEAWNPWLLLKMDSAIILLR